MQTGRSRRCAGALLAVLAATLVLPLAALARVPPRAATDRCHCPVKMACCEAGLCRGDADAAARPGASFSGCRDEAPHLATLPAPSTALDSALLADPVPGVEEAVSASPVVDPAGASARGPEPEEPPPRSSGARC